MVVPADAPEIQIKETRQAFYAGASILFTVLTMPGVLDPGDEPTDADMQKMADLQAEIDAFGAGLDKRYLNPQEH
jgi:hypothetical protein